MSITLPNFSDPKYNYPEGMAISSKLTFYAFLQNAFFMTVKYGTIINEYILSIKTRFIYCNV